MATITAQAIIDKARTQLGDIEGVVGVQYLVADLLKYLNEGQREIVKLDPQANVSRTVVQMASGTVQELPTGSLGLIDVIRNMGFQGSTPGKIVRKIERYILDGIIPDWHEFTAATPTSFYVYDVKVNRLKYEIYPPAPQPGIQNHYLEILHGATPSDILIDATILDDRYDSDLLDYILYRAKSMHAEYAGEAGEAAMHLQKFVASVASKTTPKKG